MKGLQENEDIGTITAKVIVDEGRKAGIVAKAKAKSGPAKVTTPADPILSALNTALMAMRDGTVTDAHRRVVVALVEASQPVTVDA